MLSKQDQYNEYVNNGGSMSIQEWEKDGRFDAALAEEDDKPQVINADLRKFNRTQLMVNKAVGALNAIKVIENKEQLDNAMVVLREAKTVENTIEAKRKELVKPFNDAVKKINDHAKAIVITLPVAIDNCKKVVLAFQKAEEERIAKARKESRVGQLTDMGFAFLEGQGFLNGDLKISTHQIDSYSDADWLHLINANVTAINDRLNAAYQEEKESAEDDAMFGTDDSTTAIQEWNPVTAPVATAPVVEMAKVKGVTKRWVFEVTNMKQLPIEYLQVNEMAIREAVKQGTRMIPGVRIYQEESLTIR